MLVTLDQPRSPNGERKVGAWLRRALVCERTRRRHAPTPWPPSGGLKQNRTARGAVPTLHWHKKAAQNARLNVCLLTSELGFFEQSLIGSGKASAVPGPGETFRHFPRRLAYLVEPRAVGQAQLE